MDGVAPLHSVGAVAGPVSAEAVRLQAAVKTIQVTADLGTSALKLIQAAVLDSSSTGHDLDVFA